MNKVSGRHQKKKSGFTLLELLIALSIFAMVMVMVTTGLRTVLDLRDRMKVRDQRIHQLQFAMLILERDFLQMVQYGEQTASLTYRGSGAVEFIRTGVVNPMARQDRGTLQRVNYSVLGGVLVRSATFNLFQDSKQEESSHHSTAILHDVEDFKIQFWTHQKSWADQWPEKQKELRMQEGSTQSFLPGAIVFNLKIKGLGIISRVFSIPLGGYHVFP